MWSLHRDLPQSRGANVVERPVLRVMEGRKAGCEQAANVIKSCRRVEIGAVIQRDETLLASKW